MKQNRSTARRAGWIAALLGVLLSIVPLVAGSAGAVTGIAQGGALTTKITVLKGATEHTPDAGVKEVKIGDQVVRMFCIDFVRQMVVGAVYDEVPWSQTRHPAALPKVMAVMQAWLAGPQNATTAAAAQALIWRYTDNLSLVTDPAKTPAAVVDAYNALDAASTGSGSQPAPAPTVDIGNGNTSGVAGSTFGPFIVATNQPTTALSSDNPAVIVKVNGVLAASAANGTNLTIEVPAGTPAGSAKVTATASGSLSRGRAFVSASGSQDLILIDTIPLTATDSVTVTWLADGQPPALTAVASVDCAANTVVVTVRNTGGQAGTVTVADAGAGFTQAVTVPVGGEVQVVVPIGADKAYDIIVTSGANQVARFVEALVACPPPPPPTTAPPSGGPVPQAAVVNPCNSTGVLLSLQNNGTGVANFTVTSGGAIVASGVNVVNGAPQSIAVPVTPPNYSIRVTAQGYDQTFTGSLASCSTTTTVQVAGTTVVPVPSSASTNPTVTTRPSVLGTTVAPSPVAGGQLPRTGSSSRSASVWGVALLLMGGGLLLVSTRARRAPHPIRVRQ